MFIKRGHIYEAFFKLFSLYIVVKKIRKIQSSTINTIKTDKCKVKQIVHQTKLAIIHQTNKNPYTSHQKTKQGFHNHEPQIKVLTTVT